MADPNARLIKQNEKLKEQVKALKARLKREQEAYTRVTQSLRQGEKDRESEFRQITKDRDNARAEKQQALALYHDLCARIYDRLGMVVKNP